MSIDKNRQEAHRWMRTALDDLHTARILRDNAKFAHSPVFIPNRRAKKR